ncbi:MAG: hypothetical protein ABI662_08890 [Dermatophilaceae bacterium]
MARIATRIASGLAAAGIAAIMSTAPAQAQPLPDPQIGCVGSGCANTHPNTPTPESTPWMQIALGTAAGVALAGAGAATVSSRRRHEQQAPTRQTTVAG